MAQRDRRRARKERDEAHQRAQQRIQGRTERMRDSAGPGGHEDEWLFPISARWQRRDVEAIFRGIRRGSRKQRDKHLGKRVAQLDVRRAQQRDRAEAYLTVATQTAPAQVMSVHHYGGAVPAEAWGDAVLAGEPVVWYLRYRYDAAYLELGHPAEDIGGEGAQGVVVGECTMAASVRRVTGQPYAGSFADLGSETDALAFIAQLFQQLQPPEPGTRFQDRLSNTVSLLCGDGDQTAPTLVDP